MSRDAEASSVPRGTRLPKVGHLPITPADKVRLKWLRTQQLPEMKSTEALRFPASSPLSQASRISPTQRLLPQRRHFSSDACGPRGPGLDHTPTALPPQVANPGLPPSYRRRGPWTGVSKDRQPRFAEKGSKVKESFQSLPFLGSNPCWALLDAILNGLCTDVMNMAAVS